MKWSAKKRTKRLRAGSALILAIVMSTILAVFGAMFLLTSQIHRTAASSIPDNKDLDSAIDTVIAYVSQELVLDTPGVRAGEEYYDYPDSWNTWLANLEPSTNGTNYFWLQISDVGGVLGGLNKNVLAKVVSDTNTIDLIFPGGPLADADGDGVSDSKWFPLGSSGKGQQIYAAVRVIDNCAMLNVNTIYAYAGGEDRRKGDLLTDIYIDGLVKSGSDLTSNFISNRDINDVDARTYYLDVARRIDNPVYDPNHNYTPYDMSEELSLRNRFLLFPQNVITRLEAGSATDPNRCLSTTLRWTGYGNNFVPSDTNSFGAWKRRFNPFDLGLDPNKNNYDFRHLLTTYNMDRIITPAGNRMVNVNAAGANALYSAIQAGFADANFIGFQATQLAAQLAVNIKDCTDSDADVTEFIPGTGPYGFEQPCIFISELAFIFKDINDTNDVSITHRSYAIELRKHDWAENGTGDEFELEIFDPSLTRSFWLSDNLTRNGLLSNSAKSYLYGFDSDKRKYCVLVFEDDELPLHNDVDFSDSPDDGETGVNPTVVLDWPLSWADDSNDPNWSYDIYFGMDSNNVSDANNTTGLWTEYLRGWNDLGGNIPSFDPYGLAALATDETYYWRIDDVYDGNVVEEGQVWSFTTWTKEPNTVILSALSASDPNSIIFKASTKIRLYRHTTFGVKLLVDEVDVNDFPKLVDTSGSSTERESVSCQRDIDRNQFIKRRWDLSCSQSLTLGNYNDYPSLTTDPIQVYFGSFTNVGQIGMVFKEHMYAWDGFKGIKLAKDEPTPLSEIDVRLDLTNPNFQPLFKYITRFDPAADGINNDGDLISVSDTNDLIDENLPGRTPEWKVPGRININTAPWYVIAQLPWISQKDPLLPFDPNLALAIAGYRDSLNCSSFGGPDYSILTKPPGSLLAGFKNIGELNNVTYVGDRTWSMDYYGRDSKDQAGYPDISLTRGMDKAVDDFEERDLIFARISDLATVRSDVFTAYILVRLGTNGPQKRAIAILDRSDVYPDGAGGTIGKVKIRSLHLVPDPR